MILPCARCGEPLDGLEVATVEAWEQTGLFLCDSCAEDALGDDDVEGDE